MIYYIGIRQAQKYARADRKQTKEGTATAAWLDRTFYGFDRAIFALMHSLHGGAGGFFDGFCKFVSFFGESGWFFIVLAFVFLFFKRMRREGVGMAFALVMGALVTNIILKNAVNRMRPFNRDFEFMLWWQEAGSNMENSPSFPSGHTTAAFSSMVAFFLLGDKRYSWTGLVFAFLMAFSRVYLIVHYPTDVLAGIIIGTAAGVGGALLGNLLYKKAGGKFKDLLYEFSIITFFAKLFGKRKELASEPAVSEPATTVSEQSPDENADDAATAPDKNDEAQ